MSSSSPPARTSRTRAAAVLTAGLAVAVALAACSPVERNDDDDNDPSHRSPVAPTRYVALGDSFAALGPVSAPTTGPAGCLRSTRNYPALVAQRLRAAGSEFAGSDFTGLDFTDATCGGARTVDMTTPQIPHTPPQLDALTPRTDLVTLSIGGNDIGFGDIASCVVRTPRSAAGAPCRDELDPEVSAALDDLPAALDRVYAGIRERSPDARVITTAYMPLVPGRGVTAPGAPGTDECDFVSRMSPGDVDWTRLVTERVNHAVADAARRAGAEVVAPADADERHACAPPQVRYTDFTGTETGSHPMHPTAAGQSAMADAVVDAVANGVAAPR